jgi:competence protein ComEC
MNGYIYGFCACLLSSLLWPVLFAPWTWPILVILFVISRKTSGFLCGMLLGALWVSFCFYSLFHLSTPAMTQHGEFNGQIVSLVQQERDWISFDVKVIDAQFRLFPRFYRLNWRKPQPLALGQVWRFNAKMKGITSLLNEGGFNQQKYWLSQHIVARGKVTEASLLNESKSIRQGVLERLSPILKSLEGGDILQAIILGDKKGIAPARWQALRRTGAGHLVAISGLHISVVFAAVLLLSLRLLALGFPCESQRNWVVAMGMALVVVLCYGYIAGFAIATQRAVLMLLLLVGLTLLRQFSSPWERLVWALCAVLVFDPFAPLSAGFWLSFCALSIILLTVTLGRVNGEIDDTLATSANKKACDVETQTEIHHETEHEPESTLWANPAALVKRAAWREKLDLCKHAVGSFVASLWRIQWRLALGLGLLQLLLFGTAALHSIWLNLLFVPWFSFVVIPLALVSFIFWLVCCLGYWLFLTLLAYGAAAVIGLSRFFNLEPSFFMPDFLLSLSLAPLLSLGGLEQTQAISTLVLELSQRLGPKLFYVAELSLVPFLWILDASQHLPWAEFSLATFTLAQVILALIGGVLLLYQRSRLWQIMTMSLCVPLLLTGLMTLSSHLGFNRLHDKGFIATDWQLHVLDVGQGSAIVAQQGKFGLIYDTGAAYGLDFSYAKRVILPFLIARGISEPEYLVLSHDDNDHMGGAKVLMDAFPSMTVISDIPRFADETCQQAPLIWRALTLDLMSAATEPKDNNASCVIRIGNDHGRVLLTGDIEALREFKLIHLGAPVTAEVLLAPHHGSNTSSTAAFLQAVSPQYAIFSAGFANQYGFPKPQVLTRYQSQGIKGYSTGEFGQISVDFSASAIRIRAYRTELAPFWYNQVFRFGSSQKPE